MKEYELLEELHYKLLTRWGKIVDFSSTKNMDKITKEDALDFLIETGGCLYRLTKEIESCGLFTESNIYIMKKRHFDEWDMAKKWERE